MRERFQSLTMCAIAAAILVGCAAALFAQGPRPGGRFVGGLPLWELGLSEAQERQVDEAMRRHRSEVFALLTAEQQQKARQLRAEMRTRQEGRPPR